METSKNNTAESNLNKFKVKLIGKSYVGKTTFINKINNPDFAIPYEKTNFSTNYQINFKYKYKTDIFYFVEEPEIKFDKSIFSFDYIPNKNDYIALLFMFDITEKESFEYIKNAYKNIYSANVYENVIKIIIGNKNDLDGKLKQVNKEEIDQAIKQLNAEYFEISSKKTDDVYNIISQIYTKMKRIVKKNEYSYGIENDSSYFIDKEKLIPNYYEIIIIGDRDSGKNCLKNKFLYDCCEKTVSLYEFCIPRTINLGGKEIKFDIFIKSDDKEVKEDKANELNPEFFYDTVQNLDPNNICILLTYDISNKSSFENLKKIAEEILDYSDRYKLCISLLGMKCDLLLDTELEERIKEGREVAQLLNAHYYVVSNRTGYNVDTVFNDILVQAYNKYHKNDSIPTANYYKESKLDPNIDIYNDIHVRNEKPKMKEKEKKKIEKQIEKEINAVKKVKTQKEQTLNTRKKKENEIYANQFKEIQRLNYTKVYRCTKCWKIPKIEINEINDSINVKCIHNQELINQTYKINKFIDAQDKVPDQTQCNFCKNGNYNHANNYDYCYNCQKIFCKKCDNTHKNSTECKSTKTYDKNIKNVTPFYLLESFCPIHELPTKYYCLECDKYTCDTCFKDEHKTHNLKFYDKDYVEKLIKDNKKLLENTKIWYKYLEAYFNDMMKSLKNKFNELMDLKTKKLNIKENLIKNLELYKNNFNLIESVANLKFEKVNFRSIKYNANLNWKSKLDVIFEYLNEPLYVKSTNICLKKNIGRPFNILQEIKKQSKEELEKEKKENEEKEKKEKENEEKEKKEKEEEKDKQNQLELKDSSPDSNLKIEETLINNLKISNVIVSSDNLMNMEGNPDDILITDICALSSKYFGISSDDGFLKIYNAYNYTEKPHNAIKEYQPNKGIYSLYKPHKGIHLNFNPLYLIGFETIKKLIFDNDYKIYNINEEYKIDNCYFINIIELCNLNGILLSSLNQEIINVYKNTEKKLIKNDITFVINENKDNKNIVNITEIGANKFSVKLEDKIEEKPEENVNFEKERLRRSTIGNILRKDATQNQEGKTKKEDKKNIYNIIIELEENETPGELSLKDKYEFYKNYDIIGKIGTYYLIIIDKNIETVPTLMHIFDYNQNSFIRRYYLNQNIPVLYQKLENWYKNKSVFLLLDNKMNLTQYYFDEEKTKDIKPLYSLDLKEIIVKKNKDDNVVFLNVGDKIFLFANNGLIFNVNN